MKKSIYLIFAIAVLFPAVSLAEGKANHDWAEKAAVGYEQKAEAAKKSGDAKAAAIYQRMAQIKRDAGAASKAGEPFSWDEYHQLNGQLHQGDKHVKKEAKLEQKHAKPEGKDKAAHADKKVKGDPADEFIKTSQKYEQESIAAVKAGDTEKATIYIELASIKRQAAMAVKEGKGYDWSRYHELLKKLEK